MKFRTPALAGYQDVTASVVDTDSQRVSRYQGFADVTALVQAGGAGTYWGANVQAGTGADRYAGWALAVVYTDPSKSIQQVGVYDGLTSLVAATRPSVTIPLDSFQTPATGTVNAEVGLVAWEGDADINSETATLNGSTLTDAVNATNDQFNSTISRAGAHVTTKTPNYVNQLGIDADEIDADGFIPNSATNATLALGTSQDTYLPGVVTLVNDTYLQSPANTRGAVDLGQRDRSQRPDRQSRHVDRRPGADATRTSGGAATRPARPAWTSPAATASTYTLTLRRRGLDDPRRRHGHQRGRHGDRHGAADGRRRCARAVRHGSAGAVRHDAAGLGAHARARARGTARRRSPTPVRGSAATPPAPRA